MQIEIRGVEELSPRERQVVVLKESGQANSTIARRLGIAEATVATLLHRARLKGYQVVIILPGAALGLPEEGEEAKDGHGPTDEHDGGKA